jgi:predicted alpha/beta superfamily hydrolase
VKLLRFVVPLLLLSFSASAQQQMLTRHTIQSSILGEKREIVVYVPHGYSDGRSAFPVVYLTDGDRIVHLAPTADFLVKNGRIPEMILVGVMNTDRTRDLTPTKDATRPDAPTAGGAAKFADFFERELIPYIEKSYRTQPFRIYAGHSHGGLFGFYFLTAKPALFDAIVAASPSFAWDNEYIRTKLDAMKASDFPHPVMLFFTTGNEGARTKNAFDHVEALLKAKAFAPIEWSSRYFEDEDHGSVVFPSYYYGLRFVYESWRAPINADGTLPSIAQIEQHYANVSKRFKVVVLPPEYALNAIGYQNLATGKLPDAVAAFQKNLQLYPQSPNVYDSLGEAYERMGQLELARSSYLRAQTLGRKANDPNLPAFQQHFDRVNAAIDARRQ